MHLIYVFVGGKEVVSIRECETENRCGFFSFIITGWIMTSGRNFSLP